MSNKPVPIAREANAVLEKMRPATRELALRVTEEVKRTNLETVLSRYDVGSMIDEAADDRGGKYGPTALDQIAAYMALPAKSGADYLQSYRVFAKAFDRDVVERYTQAGVQAGKQLTITHWARLATIDDPVARQQALDRCADNGWSTKELKKHCDTLAKKNGRRGVGGRKPNRTDSPVIEMGRVGRVCKALVNLAPNIEGVILEKTRATAADPDQSLAQLTQLRDSAKQFEDDVYELWDRIVHGAPEVNAMRLELDAIVAAAEKAAKAAKAEKAGTAAKPAAAKPAATSPPVRPAPSAKDKAAKIKKKLASK